MTPDIGKGSRWPDFLIVGAMRSGSTSLTRYLNDHPEIFMATPKEVGYFLHNYDRGEDWYRAHFADAGASRKAGEATPSYMVSADAITRIKHSVPDALLMVILREPVSRVYSHYWMRRERQRESRSFSVVVQNELAGADVLDNDEETDYLSHSLYARHLERLLNVFPRKQLHVVILEELARDAHAVYRAICIALGVNPDYVPRGLGRAVNSYVTFRSKKVRGLARQFPKPLRRSVDRLNTRRSAEYPAIDPSIANELAAFFAPHNRELEMIIGRSIPDWNRSSWLP